MSRGIRAGRGFFELGLDDATAIRSLRRFERRFRAAGQRISQLGASIFNLRNIGVGGLGIAAIVRETSRLEQLEGRFESVFGRLTGAARDFSNAFAVSINQSGATVRDQIATFQGALQGFGFSGEDAFPLSKQLTQAAQDLVAFNENIRSTQQATQLLLGAISGSNTEGARLFLGADVTIEALGRAAGRAADEMTLAERAATALNVILAAQGRSGAAGQALEEVDTLASIMRALAGNAGEAAASVGSALTPQFQLLFSTVNQGLRSFKEFADANGDLIRSVALGATAFVGFGGALVAAGGAVQLLAFSVGGLATVIGLLTAPIGLVATAVTAAGLSFVAFSEQGKQSLDRLLGNVSSFAQRGLAIFEVLQDGIATGGLTGGLEVATAGMRLIWERLIAQLQERWLAFRNFFASSFITATASVELAFSSLAETVLRSLNTFDTAIAKGADSLATDFLTGLDRVKVTLQEIAILSTAAFSSGGFAEARQEIARLEQDFLQRAEERVQASGAANAGRDQEAERTLAAIREGSARRAAQILASEQENQAELAESQQSAIGDAEDDLRVAQSRWNQIARRTGEAAGRIGEIENEVSDSIGEAISGAINRATGNLTTQGVAFGGDAGAAFAATGVANTLDRQLVAQIDTNKHLVDIKNQGGGAEALRAK